MISRLEMLLFPSHDRYRRQTRREISGERYLHRAVWVSENGPIPPGKHIHHIDGDTDNNNISNLEIMGSSEHLSHHTNQPNRIEYAKWHMETRMRPKAIEWHRSEEGRKFHSERGKLNGQLPPRFERQCEECGGEFLSKQRRSRFCSNKCYARTFRRRNPGYYSNEQKAARLLSKRTRTT